MQSSPAFLLHYRRFSDSRTILEFFSEKHGLLKGVFRSSSSRFKQFLPQAFTEYQVDWIGQRDLKTLTSIESVSNNILVSGKELFCGMYINEILQKLFKYEEPAPELYSAYKSTLKKVSLGDHLEESLRRFESILFNDLGITIDFEFDADSKPIAREDSYFFKPALGFVLAYKGGSEKMISGKVIDIIRAFVSANTDVDFPLISNELKRIHRKKIDYLLDGKTLKSRELFS